MNIYVLMLSFFCYSVLLYSQNHIPKSIENEHHEIHAELKNAVNEKGETGKAASEVEKLLSKHFEKEEEFAMPPLGYLQELSSGKVNDKMKDIVALTVKLKKELPVMLSEHKSIVAALDKLETAAKKEKKQDVLKFIDKLKNHALNEEEVLYPAAILVGDYISLKLQKK